MKSKIGNIVAKASGLRIILNIDGTPLSLSSSSTFPPSLPFSVFHSAQTCWVTQQRLKSWGCAGPKKCEPKFIYNLVYNFYIFYNFLTGSSLWGTVHLVQASPPNIQSLSFASTFHSFLLWFVPIAIATKQQRKKACKHATKEMNGM